MTTASKCALIMAGGTGGHIFPGLAVAQALRARGWRVHWLGAPASMESRLVPPHGFALETVDFSGIRGKGLATLLLAPLRLLRASWQSLCVMRRVRPDVLVGFGGYITLPAGLVGALSGRALVLHEQNSVAGMANRVLARLARRVFTAFPDVLPQGQWVGNPLRTEFLNQPGPQERLGARSGTLRLLVVGGSLGARALNTVVPQALAQLPPKQRPLVTHQSGEKQIDELRANYAAAGIDVQLSRAGSHQDPKAPGRSDAAGSGSRAVPQGTSAGVTLVPFIDNMAQAYADADLVICRAGASTVTEVAAVGAAAVLVPFPSAVDDHQTHNARFLADRGAAWLVPQAQLTPEFLADMLQKTELATLIARGLEAKKLQKTEATQAVVAACEELAA